MSGGWTPGPWRVDETGDIVSGPYNVCIPYATRPEDKQMMASAPALYEALAALMDNTVALYAAIANGNVDAGQNFANADPHYIAARQALVLARPSMDSLDAE